MSSTAHQRHKCTQLMLSAVLMGFLSLSWRLCRSLNCSHVFPFRRFLRSVMYPPRKLRHSLEGKAELEEVLYNERCFCLLFERTFGSSWHLNLMMLLCLHRQRCQAVVQDKEAALTLSWALVYPVPQSCVPAPSCAPQQGFAVPCQHCWGPRFTSLGPNTDFSWGEVNVQRTSYSSCALLLVLQQGDAGISTSLLLECPVDAESTNELHVTWSSSIPSSFFSLSLCSSNVMITISASAVVSKLRSKGTFHFSRWNTSTFCTHTEKSSANSTDSSWTARIRHCQQMLH